MYGYFKGTIAEISDASFIIEVNNIGYNIMMPLTKIYDLGSVGDQVKVYTYTNVREDAINLFGFPTKEELDLFKLLITVSGVGPKGAQSILNSFVVEDIKKAISSGDFVFISKAAGIGKKTAERIIIDLKDKITSISPDKNEVSLKTSFLSNSKDIAEAVEALVFLGYSKKDSEKAINEVALTEYDSVDQLVMKALKKI